MVDDNLDCFGAAEKLTYSLQLRPGGSIQNDMNLGGKYFISRDPLTDNLHEV